jgi:hypothetical protein
MVTCTDLPVRLVYDFVNFYEYGNVGVYLVKKKKKSVFRVLIPYSMIMYDWNGQEALRNFGILSIISSLIGLGVYLLYAYTSLGKM